MVEYHRSLNDLFKALAHDARRDMLARLAERPLTVTELAEPLSMSLAAASKHVQVLEESGLVRRTIEDRRHICTLDARPLASASAWLRFYEPFWNQRLDALEKTLTKKGRKR